MSDTSKSTLPGRVAGIDYGTVRVGVAISDPARSIASPLCVHTLSGEQADAKFFKTLVQDEDIRLFVVGVPVHLSGQESQKSAEARQFAAWLTQITGVPHALEDERYSSKFAEDALMAAGLTKKRRKERIDMLAAQGILAAYLQRGDAAPPDLAGLDER